MNNVTDDLPRIFVYTPFANFVLPYIERALKNYQPTSDPANAVAAVMISSSEIYAENSSMPIDEECEVDESGEHFQAEQKYTELCNSTNLAPTILRCAPIIGTGMDGWPRHLAERINQGRFFAIRGNEATRSVVHAVSVANAVAATLGNGETFNVTDGCLHTLNEIADALAWRIAQKRIFMLKPNYYRFFFGKRRFCEDTKTMYISSDKIAKIEQFKPVSVTEYLKNHVYDESSL